jgi:Tol biopolymer transport system component
MRLRNLAILVVCIAGCDKGVDSWADFQHQHLYNGGPPTLSPEGKIVLFSTPISGHGDIYRISRSGITRLTCSDEFEAQPLCSPSRDCIAYVRESGPYQSSTVRILNKITREVVKDLEVPPGLKSNPSLSYDGRQIGFCLLEPKADDVSVYFISRDSLLLHKLR